MLTGRSPFYKRGKSELAYQVVQENKRPLPPQDSERLGITASVWDMMVNCWDKKVSARLQIESVITCLTKAARVWVVDVPAFLLASEAGVAHVMGMQGDEAQNFADKLYKVVPPEPKTVTLDADAKEQTLASTEINSPSGKTYLTRLKALCDTSGILPSSLMLSGELEDLGTRPLKSSGSADIHKATYRGRLVAVKTLNVRRTQKPEDLRKVGMWRFASIV